MEAAARASLNSAAFNHNIRATMGPGGGGGPSYFGYTPPQPLSSVTPHHTAQMPAEETTAKIECTVKYRGRVVLTGYKCQRTGLWMIPLTPNSMETSNPTDHTLLSTCGTISMSNGMR